MNNTPIRLIKKEDLPAIEEVLLSSGLFPPEFLSDMIADFFHNPSTQESWVTYILDNKPVALGYGRPEALTDETYNLLAIVVLQVTFSSLAQWRIISTNVHFKN